MDRFEFSLEKINVENISRDSYKNLDRSVVIDVFDIVRSDWIDNLIIINFEIHVLYVDL